MSVITATFTGPRQTSLFPKAARPAAPCATYCCHASGVELTRALEPDTEQQTHQRQKHNRMAGDQDPVKNQEKAFCLRGYPPRHLQADDRAEDVRKSKDSNYRESHQDSEHANQTTQPAPVLRHIFPTSETEELMVVVDQIDSCG